MHFLHHTRGTQKNFPDVFAHTIYLVKAGHTGVPSIVMRTLETPCATESRVETATSYIGSTFQLQRGDALYVTVNYKQYVRPVPHMNFFGVHML